MFVLPGQHSVSVHRLLFEGANVASSVRPLHDPIVVDEVLEQGTRVATTARPRLVSLAQGAPVFEDTRDDRTVRERMTTRSHHLAVVPQAFELCAVYPMEFPAALQLATVKMAVIPASVGLVLSSLALDAIV